MAPQLGSARQPRVRSPATRPKGSKAGDPNYGTRVFSCWWLDAQPSPKYNPWRIHGAGICANMWGILMVNVTIYRIHGSYGYWLKPGWRHFIRIALICRQTHLVRAYKVIYPRGWLFRMTDLGFVKSKIHVHLTSSLAKQIKSPPKAPPKLRRHIRIFAKRENNSTTRAQLEQDSATNHWTQKVPRSTISS